MALPLNTSIAKSILPYYPNATTTDIESIILAMENDIKKYLIDKGYLSSDGSILKIYQPRINPNLGVNLNPFPPRKR